MREFLGELMYLLAGSMPGVAVEQVGATAAALTWKDRKDPVLAEKRHGLVWEAWLQLWIEWANDEAKRQIAAGALV
jgi:hypothetical protein